MRKNTKLVLTVLFVVFCGLGCSARRSLGIHFKSHYDNASIRLYIDSKEIYYSPDNSDNLSWGVIISTSFWIEKVHDRLHVIAHVVEESNRELINKSYDLGDFPLGSNIFATINESRAEVKLKRGVSHVIFSYTKEREVISIYSKKPFDFE